VPSPPGARGQTTGRDPRTVQRGAVAGPLAGAESIGTRPECGLSPSGTPLDPPEVRTNLQVTQGDLGDAPTHQSHPAGDLARGAWGSAEDRSTAQDGCQSDRQEWICETGGNRGQARSRRKPASDRFQQSHLAVWRDLVLAPKETQQLRVARESLQPLGRPPADAQHDTVAMGGVGAGRTIRQRSNDRPEGEKNYQDSHQ